MSFLDDLRKRFGKQDQDLKGTSLGYILWKQTGCRRNYIPDRHMDLLRKEDVMTFLWIDKTDKKEYAEEKWDCDDFARELYCRAKTHFAEKRGLNAVFGFVRIAKHRHNFFVDTARNVWFIEPQNDVIYKPRKRPQFTLI